MSIDSPLSVISVVCAAIIGGVFTSVGLFEVLDPIPENRTIANISQPRCVRATAEADCIREATSARRSCRKMRIADVWSGPRRTGAFRVSGFSSDGRVEASCVDAYESRTRFDKMIRRALRERGKAPIEERYARRADNPFDTPEARRCSRDGNNANDGPAIYADDVFISGLPMVNQGARAYCAVASAARVLQGYGINVSMDDLAAMAQASEVSGTHPCLWENAIRRIANSHGLELRVVAELTETSQPLSNLLYNYNQTARDLGCEELYTWDYANAFVSNYAAFDNDRVYDVQRAAMLSNERITDAFDKNVTERINESDPIFWTVLMGDVPETAPNGLVATQNGNRSSHMRLIIGYNESRGEILYSDSWGEGHELKRMDAADALSITTAMYYLTD